MFERIYNEKEWNDMENYYMAELDKARESKKAVLPLEVYEAFTRLEREWKKYLDKKSIDLLLLTLMSVHAVGDALVLKRFALENATTYLQAILNGYCKEEKSTEKAVATIIDNWLDAPHLGSKEEDIRAVAKEITIYFKEIHT